jgi:uncharacterized membrane protein
MRLRERVLLTVLASAPWVLQAALDTWAQTRLSAVPARLVIHWNVRGPDRWIETTAHAVQALVEMIGGGCVALGVGAILVAWSRTSDSLQTPAARRVYQFRRLGAWLLIGCEFFGAVLAAMSLATVSASAVRIWGALLTTFLIALSGAMIFAYKKAACSIDEAIGHRDNTQPCWRRGIYYNPDDPSFWVPKRIGVGWTINFAHPWAWPVLAVLVLVPVAVVTGIIAAVR